jgi:hypothetical protein
LAKPIKRSQSKGEKALNIEGDEFCAMLVEIDCTKLVLW